MVEAPGDIAFNYPVGSPTGAFNLIQCGVTASIRPKTVRIIAENWLVDCL